MGTNKKIIRAVTVDQSLGFVEPLIGKLKEGYEVQILSSEGKNLERICQQYNIKGFGINMYRRISLFKDIKSLLKLTSVFRKEKPYMVHSMTPKAGMLCMLAAWITRVPRRVHTFTGLIWPTSHGLRRKVLMFTDWITCACATHIIPEGKGVLDDLQNSITNKPMKVLGYGNVRGVDMGRFSKRIEIEKKVSDIRKENLFTFIFVGRIVRDKGINELVEAFVLLQKKYNDVRLLLIGNYEDSIDPLNKTTKEKIESSAFIEYLGPKRGDDLVAYYAASDCFVFPSYREGFPNTVMEAGAMDLPCVVTDINGSREIIEDGVNGLIVPSKRIDELYNAMEKMLSDKEMFSSMQIKARPMIGSRFEQGFVRQCLLDFYDKIL